MSRIRIVEGTITKNTGGDHYMYSEGIIAFNAAEFINESAPLHSYGDPIKAPEVKNAKKIANMYWTYGDTKLNSKSRFYVDMNLVIETMNYKEGETVSITIKNEDGQPLTDELDQLNLTGTVGKNNMVIFEGVLKDYTLNLLGEDNSESAYKE